MCFERTKQLIYHDGGLVLEFVFSTNRFEFCKKLVKLLTAARCVHIYCIFFSSIIEGNRRSEMIQEVPQAEEEKGDEEKKDDEKPVEKTGT